MDRSTVVVGGDVELRDLIARALFRDSFRMRSWDSAKGYLQQTMYKRADEAIKRAGVENVTVPVNVSKYGTRENRKDR